MAVGRSVILSLCTIYATPSIAQVPVELDIQANDIAYSAQTGMLYASVPSAAGLAYGNRIVEISTIDATITRSVFVGSEPGPIGVSPDAAVAYVGLDGAATVRPIDLSTLTAGTAFSLGTSMYDGPRYAAQIAVMTGSPNTVAITRRNHGYSPSFEGVAIYDSGVARPNVDNDIFGSTTIAFGSQASTLYGYDNEDTSFTLNRMTIDALGVSTVASQSNVIYGFNVKIITQGDMIFATSGAAVDGTQLQLLGTYVIPGTGFSGTAVVDSATSSVIFASGNLLSVFDRDTFLPLNTITVSAAAGNPISAASCGTECVAVLYDSSQIFVLQGLHGRIFADGFE
jgi:hypothetical protein